MQVEKIREEGNNIKLLKDKELIYMSLIYNGGYHITMTFLFHWDIYNSEITVLVLVLMPTFTES